MDGELIEQWFEDRSCLREILQLSCFCLNKSNGCSWVGLLYELDEHLSDCPYVIVICPLAECKVLRKDLENHKTQSCKGLSNQPCQFTNIGCDFRGSSDELKSHLKEDVTDHFIFVAKAQTGIKNSLESTLEQLKDISTRSAIVDKKLETEGDALIATQETLKGVFSKAEVIRQDMGEMNTWSEVRLRRAIDIEKGTQLPSRVLTSIQEVKDYFNTLNKRVLDIEKEAKNGGAGSGQKQSLSKAEAKKYSDQMDRLERTGHILNVQLADLDLKIRLFQATTFDGKYIWKIDSYTKRFREAVTGKIPELYSPPLFTATFGYKVCCKLHLNGDPAGKDGGYKSHVSFYLIVMKGEYDALLGWPFKRSVTITLLDHDKKGNVEKVIRPDSKHLAFKRPTDEMNPVIGFSKFVSHEELSRRGYIRDDALFFKVIISE